MDNPLHWLYQQSGQRIASGPALCYLCGHICTEEHPVARAIADTFNSHWRAACRSSDWLCDACAWYLDSKGGHEDYRKMSLVVARNAWHNWRRADMKADIARWLRDGLEEDSYLVCSLTKKKHILLQAPFNASGVRSLAIQVEEQRAFFGPVEWWCVAEPFDRLLALGHGKGEILSGNLYANTIRKHGQIQEAMELSKRLNEWRDGSLLELYSYVTILEEKGQTIDDGPGRKDDERAESGDAANRSGLTTIAGGLEEHRPRIQKPVSRGNLAAIRGAHCDGSTHDGHTASISQSSLWDAEDCESGD